MRNNEPRRLHIVGTPPTIPHTTRRTAQQARSESILFQHGWVIPFYLIVALLFTYPMILHLKDAIVGQQDALENFWNLWWAKKALLQLGQDPFQATYMQYPYGLPLYFHTYNIMNGLLSLPLQVCCGTAAAYNLMTIFAFVMAALGAYALLWYLTQSQSAALLAGLIYAFSPYMAFHLDIGQPFMLALEWFPFYLLALLIGLRHRFWMLITAGILLTIIALTDWQYLTYALMITGITALYEAWGLRRSPRDLLALIGKLALVGGLFALMISPVLIPMLREYAKEPYARRPVEHTVVHSVDLLAFVLPSIYHPIWGEWASKIFFGRFVEPFVIGGMATLGYTPLLLAACALVGAWRKSALFLLIFGVFAVLALGPYLQVNGVNSFNSDHPIPLPYLWFRELPFMDIPRIPSRFISVVTLALAVMAGIGLAWLLARLPARRAYLRRPIAALAVLLVLFEFWPRPFRMTPVNAQAVSPFYRMLGADQSSYAIIDVPHLWKPSMLNQIYHDKPTVGGRIARVRLHPWWDGRIFGPLLQARTPWADVGATPDTPSDWMAALSCQNIRYVTFYKQGVDEGQLKGIANIEKTVFAGIQPVYEDETLRAYGPISSDQHTPFWTTAVGEWFDPETNADGLTYRWAQDNTAALLLYPCGNTNVTLKFDTSSFARARTIQISNNGQPLQSITLPPDALTSVTVPLQLSAGENRIELQSDAPAESAKDLGLSDDTRKLSFLISRVSVTPEQ